MTNDPKQVYITPGLWLVAFETHRLRLSAFITIDADTTPKDMVDGLANRKNVPPNEIVIKNMVRVG